MESLRVYYVERQRLVVADLQSEQEYLAGLDERHNRLQHAPGIVRGLRLNAESAMRYVVEAGVAIDSFGRELVLAQPETIILNDDAAKCADVWLVYCRQPLRLRQTGRAPCSANTFQRWTELPRVVVVMTEKKAAAAAGKQDDPVSPVDGAVFLGRINCEETRGIDYTTLLGVEVADPGSRALMQVGPRTGWDKSGFMLSIMDAAGNPVRRIVLDRRNNNTLYGTMELLEYRAGRIVTAFDKAVHLMVEARRAGKIGEAIQIEEKEEMENGKPTATFTFLNTSRESELPPSEKLTINDDAAAIVAALEAFNKTSQLVSISFIARLVNVLKNSVRLMVEAKGQSPSLDDIKVELTETITGGKPTATLTFSDTSVKVGPPPPPENLTISADPAVPAELTALIKKIAEFNKTSRLVRLKVFEVVGPNTDKLPRPIVSDDRLPALTLDGGALLLEAWPAKQESTNEEQRGCYDSSARAVLNNSDEPNGLSFLPISPPPQGPPTPGLYMVSLKSGELTTEQLRFDLGEKKDADNSVRFSLGTGSGPNRKLDSWLTICGNCLVTLIGGDTSDPQKPPTSFQVTGSIEQSPIKPDTTDPQFNDLLVAAWMAGLQSSVAASTVVDLTIENPPRFVETGEPVSYTIRLTNKGGVAVGFDKLLANLSTGVVNLKKQGEIPANGSIAIPVTHETNQRVPGNLTIEILASGKLGNFPWQKSGPQPPVSVEVVESPELDLSDLPETVPPDTDWSHRFRVVNKSPHRISLTEVNRTEGAVVTPFLPMPQDLPPLQAVTFGPVSHPGGVRTDLTVIFSVKYQWENGPQGSNERRRTIRVERQLNLQPVVQEPIPFDDDWSYSLVLTNVGTKELRLIALEQRLTSAPFTTPFEEIVVPADKQLLSAGKSERLKTVTGLRVTTATDTVTLEIRARYEVDGKAFDPQPDSTEIAVEDNIPG